jgi:hypothetical protein
MQNITNEIIEVVCAQLEPQQVFEQDDLKKWAADNCTPGDVFPDKELLEWVGEHKDDVTSEFALEDLFSTKALRTWAEENGYARAE